MCNGCTKTGSNSSNSSNSSNNHNAQAGTGCSLERGRPPCAGFSEEGASGGLSQWHAVMPRSVWRLILGPPGTGKTTEMGKRIQAEVEAGTPESAIAVVAFTRAAMVELRARLGGAFADDRDSTVRTIHSTAFRLLRDQGEEPKLMDDEAWRAFGATHAYSLTPMHESDDGDCERLGRVLPRRTAHDHLRYVVEWAANRRVSTTEAHRTIGAGVDGRDLLLFERRLRAFTAEHGLLTFSDLLTECLRHHLRPNVSVAFIDEGQDLSPLQIALVEFWFQDCASVVVAGDDDQCIYGFQAADPLWLARLARDGDSEVLTQSHRVPPGPHTLAVEVLRLIRDRVPKTYFPRAAEAGDAAEDVVQIPRDAVVDLLASSRSTETFVLARNRYSVDRLAKELFDDNVPFWSECSRTHCPLADAELMAAVAISARAGSGGFLAFSDFKFLAGRFLTLPAGALDDPQLDPGGVGFQVPAGLEEWFRARVAEVGVCRALDRVDLPVRRYLNAVMLPSWEPPVVALTLMTIHASKGRQADRIVILPEMSGAPYRALLDHQGGGAEGEHRIAYVALTRAIRQVVLVLPSGRKFYDYGALVDAARRRAREAPLGDLRLT